MPPMASVGDMVPAQRGADLRGGQFRFRGRRAGQRSKRHAQEMRSQRLGKAAEPPPSTRRHAAILGGQLWVSA